MNGDSVAEFVIGVVQGGTSVRWVWSVSGTVGLGPFVAWGEANVPLTITFTGGGGTSLVGWAFVATRACTLTGVHMVIRTYVVVGTLIGPGIGPWASVWVGGALLGAPLATGNIVGRSSC